MKEYTIKSRLDRQVILYTSDAKSPERSFPISPRALTVLSLTDVEAAYVKANYNDSFIIKG